HDPQLRITPANRSVLAAVEDHLGLGVLSARERDEQQRERQRKANSSAHASNPTSRSDLPAMYYTAGDGQVLSPLHSRAGSAAAAEPTRVVAGGSSGVLRQRPDRSIGSV